MIPVKQAADVLRSEQAQSKRLAAVAAPGSKEQVAANLRAEAFGLALFTLNFMIPQHPVFDPHIGSYMCGNCGCIVGFETRPGVRCYACPQCMKRVDWIGHE